MPIIGLYAGTISFYFPPWIKKSDVKLSMFLRIC